MLRKLRVNLHQEHNKRLIKNVSVYVQVLGHPIKEQKEEYFSENHLHLLVSFKELQIYEPHSIQLVTCYFDSLWKR